MRSEITHPRNAFVRSKSSKNRRNWNSAFERGIVEVLESRRMLAASAITLGTSSVTTNSAALLGQVFANGTTVNNLFQYSTSDQFLPSVKTTFASGLHGPNDVDLDANGNVLVVEMGDINQQFGAVRRYTPAGS